MDSPRINVSVNSEIGKLEHVLIHTPGPEIENMDPESAHNYLYSDILNLQVCQKEYKYFKKVLQKVAQVHEISDLLAETLEDEQVKFGLIDKICQAEHVMFLADYLKTIEPKELAKQLIEGVQISNITFINKDRFTLPPLPNLFFMRDASFTMFDNLMISNMAHEVRIRETLILSTIYNHHPAFEATVINPAKKYCSNSIGTVEGGDVQIVRDDIILSGLSDRTNKAGIDALVEHLKTKPGVKHLIFQQLPMKPESFIHLDMTFTMLDVDQCMVYEPVIMKSSAYKTFHITIDGTNAIVKEEYDIPTALNKLGMSIEPIPCGGDINSFFPAREQWHSGANFFAFAPGKVIGYGRNTHTLQALNDHGFEIIPAVDVANGKVNPDDYKKCVVAIEGNELCRGGGGARCMTMPVFRQRVDW